MPKSARFTIEKESNDLLGPMRRPAVPRLRTDDGNDVAREPFKTGILPSQALEYCVKVSREIGSLEPVLDDQFQPASLDLRLGPIAYRVRASFLPGKNATVKQKLEELAMHEMDITLQTPGPPSRLVVTPGFCGQMTWKIRRESSAYG